MLVWSDQNWSLIDLQQRQLLLRLNPTLSLNMLVMQWVRILCAVHFYAFFCYCVSNCMHGNTFRDIFPNKNHHRRDDEEVPDLFYTFCCRSSLSQMASCVLQKDAQHMWKKNLFHCFLPVGAVFFTNPVRNSTLSLWESSVKHWLTSI